MRPAILLTLNGALFIGALCVFVSLRQTRNALQPQAREAQARQDQVAALRAERDRLRAALPSELELAMLRADEEALAKLRAELADLRQRAEHRIRHPETEAEVPPQRKAVEDPPLSPSEWTNLGQENATDALITTLWALAQGEVDILADLIALTPGGRDKLQTFLADLPPHLRLEQSSPERMAALLAARDRVPTAIQILHIDEHSTEHASWASLRVRLTTAEGKEKTPILLAFRNTQTGGWRLQIPEPIVDYYLGELKGAPATQ